MTTSPRPFDTRRVEAELSGTEFDGHLLHLPSTPSTQALALAAARAGARHGVWIADEQTAGRGRGAHLWHSPPGAGLYFSALVIPPIPLPGANLFSLRVALACQAAIAEIGGFVPRDEIDIRWPNDLILHGRKCGGILIESAIAPAPAPLPPADRLRFAVIGIGINCNHLAFPPDLDRIATSLRRESRNPDQPVSREALLVAVLRNLDKEIRSLVSDWRGTNNQPSLDLRTCSSWIEGKHVEVAPDPFLAEGDANRSYTGVTKGLTAEGFLRILADDGSTRIVRTGGIRELP